MSKAVPRPRRELLPLLDEEWEWKSFERFCLGYVLAQEMVTTAHLYGKRGEKQKGIDVVATLGDGRTRTYQCRRYKSFSLKQTKKTVADDEYAADEHVILLACDAPAGVRDWIKNQAQWSVEDVEDISAAVRGRLPRQIARELVEDSFGPAVRRAFVGPDGVLAFYTPGRYFAPYLVEDRLLHQRTDLVGRTQELSKLIRVVTDSRSRVVVLTGAGGSGKTRIARSLAEALDQDGASVLMAAEGVSLDPALVDGLPQEDLVVVVDDAHARDDLLPLLSHGRRADPLVTIVLVARPQATDELVASARRAGFAGTEIEALPPLDPLEDEDLRAIAVQVLGERDGRVSDLAHAADESPLLCLVGAELLAREEIPPAALRARGDFREEVLGRFSNELLGRVSPTVEAGVVRRLLELLSALGPISVEDEPLTSEMAEQLQVPPSELRRAIAELEVAGLVQARGRLRRVTPDVLADRLLAQAALDRTGAPTGFVDELYTRYGDKQLDRLLTNVAVLDWHARQGQGDLLGGVWGRLTSRFDGSGAFERVQMLEQLRPIAALQPLQTLALARHAIGSQTPPEQYSPIFDLVSGQPDVDRAALGLLEGVAQHASLLEEAMSLLWQLGRNDTRPLDRTSAHPLKVLANIGSYGRPREHPEALLGFVERLVRLDGDSAAVAPAIWLLRRLLDREVESITAQSVSVISTRSLPVLADRTAPLRKRARDLLADRALGGDARERLLAVEMLTDALRQPHGLYGRGVTDEELDSWHEDQLALVEALEALFGQVGDPVVRNRVRRGLAWHADFSRWTDVAQRSAQVVAAPASLDERLLGEMVQGWDHSKTVQDMLTRRDLLAQELVAAFPEGKDLAEHLDGLLRGAESAGVQVVPGTLLGAACVARPGLCAGAVDWILEREASPLDRALSNLLEGIRRVDGNEADARALRVADLTAERRLQAVSYVTSSGPLTEPSVHEQALFDRFLADADTAVREQAAIGLMRLAHWETDPQRAKRLLLAFDPMGDEQCAEHLASATSDLGLSSFTDVELGILLGRLEAVSSLGYHAQRLLEEVGMRGPGVAIELLLRRLRADSDDGAHGSRFEAMPDKQLGPRLLGGAQSATEYGELVRRLRDEFPLLSGMGRYALASGFWDIVAEGWVGLEVLEESLVAEESAMQGAALTLLSEMPWRLLFSLGFPLALMIERVAGKSALLAGKVQDVLLGVAQAGQWERTPGQPAPRHVETKECAVELAQRITGLPLAHRLYLEIARRADIEMADDARRDEEENMLFGR